MDWTSSSTSFVTCDIAWPYRPIFRILGIIPSGLWDDLIIRRKTVRIFTKPLLQKSCPSFAFKLKSVVKNSGFLPFGLGTWKWTRKHAQPYGLFKADRN